MPLINAREESLAVKATFRGAVKHRRCIILACGYYEWLKSGIVKQPYFIHHTNNISLAFAGLWEKWSDDEGNTIHSCTIVTRLATPSVAMFHDRMPLILKANDYEKWLDVKNYTWLTLRKMLIDKLFDELEAFPVSTKVNSSRYKSEDCVYPLQADN